MATDTLNASPSARRSKGPGREVLSWTGLEAGLIVFFGVVSTPLVALLLGPENLGKAGVALAVIGLVEIVCALGMQDGLIRSPSIHTEVTDSANTAIMLLAIAGMLFICAIAGPVARVYGDPEIEGLLRVASLFLPINAAIIVPVAVLTRKFRAKPLSLRNTLARAVTLSFTVVLALSGIGAMSVIAGGLAGSAVSAILILSMTKRFCRFRFRWHDVKPLASFGAAICAETLITTGTIRIFALLIGYLHGITALGYFQLAQRLIDELASVAQTLIMRYGLAYFSSLNRGGRSPTAVLLKGTKILAYISLPLFGGLAICANDLVLSVFGTDWQAAAPILQFCAIAWMLAFPTLLVPPLLRSAGRQTQLVAFAAVCAAAALITLVATQTLPLWAVGASWAARHVPGLMFSALAVSALCAVTPWTLLRQLLKPAIAVAAMLLVVSAFIDFSGLQPLARMIASAAIGCVTYVIAALILDWTFWRSVLRAL